MIISILFLGPVGSAGQAPSDQPDPVALPPGGGLGSTAAAFADGPEPSSLLHGRALRLMGLQPGLPYAQALIRAARP